MAMPNFFDRLKVRTPSYNIFPQTTQNKLTFAIGRNIPVYYNELHAGEEIDLSVSQVTRFMPMLAPVYHEVNLEFIPFFCPYRLLQEYGFQSDDFFNPATLDSERPAIPMVSIPQIYGNIDSIIGSIWDYLRYPTYVWLLQLVQEDDKERTSMVDAKDGSETQLYYQDLFNVPSGKLVLGVGVNFNTQFTAVVYKFYPWIQSRILTALGKDIVSFPWLPTTELTWDISSDVSSYWEQVYKTLGIRQDQAVQEYVNYLHNEFVKAMCASEYTVRDVSLLPWLCYNKVIQDWFINTNITDISNFSSLFSSLLEELVYGSDINTALIGQGLTNLEDYSFYFLHALIEGGSPTGIYDAKPASALWQNDYFTSAFPTAQNDAAVPIPANGTIPDLRNASRLQKFRERTLFAGKRLIDQIFAHRGVRSSDARLDRVEVIGKKLSFRLRISDVLQTSQSSVESPQGEFAGHGIFLGGDHLCHYRCEEPGLVMVIARVRPRSEYVDAVPRIIYKSDFYDFENPEFDNVGMQPVMADEHQAGLGESTQVFGWHRRYTEYMQDFDQLHADMKTSLDFWHMARRRIRRALSTNFITMQADQDGYNRIFASPGDERNVIGEFTFNVAVSRPLSKYVQFDF